MPMRLPLNRLPAMTSEVEALAFSKPTALRSATLPVTRASQSRALADVEAGVGGAGGVGVGDGPVLGVERVDAVEAVVGGGHVVDRVAVERRELGRVDRVVAGAAVAEGAVLILDARDEDAVEQGRADREVLDADAVGRADHAEVAGAAPVDDGLVAVEAAEGDLGGRDADLLLVDAGADEDHAAFGNRLDCFGDRGRVLGDADEGGGVRLCAVAVAGGRGGGWAREPGDCGIIGAAAGEGR